MTEDSHECDDDCDHGLPPKNLDVALAQMEAQGILIGGYTVRLVFSDENARNPAAPLHEAISNLIERAFEESRFQVLLSGEDQEGRHFGVFDGIRLCPHDEVQERLEEFDTDLQTLLREHSAAAPSFSLGFLAPDPNDDKQV